ncbi:hypothetical protein QJS10_CPB22g00857 [Acorus calamus]|uniref:Uncharacterized protein n=1 Tax=Acorus calamus TaxID=4465 RepID=A0AAV9C0D2_ACOCL|nr:hypothetical protein QJS10_CPB22g00857 [Acorus calamus]
MLMFFNLVITPTMASRGIPTDAKPVEKESQVADAPITYRTLTPNKPVFSVPRGQPYIGCGNYPYRKCSPPHP